MKIVLPGGSGQVGQVIAGHFHNQADEVVVLSRDPQPASHLAIRSGKRPPRIWSAAGYGACGDAVAEN